MTDTTIKCKNINELHEVATQLLDLHPDKKVFLFSGKMGAGKTTLIKEICNVSGVTDIVSSPTFSIVNEYRTASGKKIFHFDLYRIKSSNELLDIGYEEYLFSDSVCLIEWPELALELMPSSFVLIEIEVNEKSGERLFHISNEGKE